MTVSAVHHASLLPDRAPLFMYGGCEGVIAVQSSHARAFRADHQCLLESLGLQIATALQNAHLYELAMVDGLTGLFMRRYFDVQAELRLLVGGTGSRALLETASYDLVNGDSYKAQDP